MNDLKERDPRTYAIIGAAMAVHRELGCGFLEAVYQEALEIELESRGVPFRRQVELPVHYKGRLLNKTYCADLIGYDTVIVELKALAKLSGTEEAQVLNCLKATGLQVGLLLNFGSRSLEYRRFVLSKSVSSAKSAAWRLILRLRRSTEPFRPPPKGTEPCHSG
jgi:GxxExxY protein